MQLPQATQSFDELVMCFRLFNQDRTLEASISNTVVNKGNY